MLKARTSVSAGGRQQLEQPERGGGLKENENWEKKDEKEDEDENEKGTR